MANDSYTATKGRKFGLTVGGAFAVIALVSLSRDHMVAPKILGAIASALIAGALIAPRSLQPVEKAWMRLAHAISRVTTPIFMAIVYFVVLTPFGILRRTFGRNPIEHKPVDGSYWIARHARDSEKERLSMERQF
jgi:hypothetical protein